MPTPWPLPSQAGCHSHYLCRVSFSPITSPPVEPRDGALLPIVKRHFTQLVVATRWPGHHTSLAIHWSHGIDYGPVLATSNWMHLHTGALLLIFPAASIKLCFIRCCQTLFLFRPQRHFSKMSKNMVLPSVLHCNDNSLTQFLRYLS